MDQQCRTHLVWGQRACFGGDRILQIGVGQAACLGHSASLEANSRGLRQRGGMSAGGKGWADTHFATIGAFVVVSSGTASMHLPVHLMSSNLPGVHCAHTNHADHFIIPPLLAGSVATVPALASRSPTVKCFGGCMCCALGGAGVNQAAPAAHAA